MILYFSLNINKYGDLKTLQIVKILGIILRKLQNSKKKSKNKTILRKRMLVNTGCG